MIFSINIYKLLQIQKELHQTSLSQTSVESKFWFAYDSTSTSLGATIVDIQCIAKHVRPTVWTGYQTLLK